MTSTAIPTRTERLRLAVPITARTGRLAALYGWDRLRRSRPARPGEVPVDYDAVTPEWLTWALSKARPGVRVTALRAPSGTEGTTSRRRLEIEYAASEDLPPTMFAKSATKLAHRVLLENMGLITGEVGFFTHLRPEVPVNAPDSYFAARDDAAARFIVLLEDLDARSATYGHATQPLDPDAAGLVVDALARLHAHLWESPRLATELAWLPTPDRGRFIDFNRAAGMFVGKGLKRAGELVPDSLKAQGSFNEAYFRLQAANATGPATFLHGDSHLGNLFFEPDGTPGFLDWQCVRRGSWAHDVGYFVVSALDVESRRSCERELVERYRRGLSEHGVEAPSADDVWHRYRQQPAYGLPMWLGTLALGDYQTDEISSVNVERFATAALDLDTFAALA
jgi:thiamine kinase-like enzyme